MNLDPLITIADADANLPIEIYPEWNSLADPNKQYHIDNASNYTKLNWNCTDEDFETPALSDDAKRAVSLYSEADRAGNLYQGVSSIGSQTTGAITQETLKAGSLEKTIKYSESGGGSSKQRPLRQADDIFKLLGCAWIAGGVSKDLTRV